MEKLKRSLFFWTLVLIFLIIAPSVVMYAKGYRFDFSRGVFVHSGSISLKTNPQDIEVYIDGELKSSSINRINNSFNITGLIPREYTFTIKAPGFRDLTKKADVHSGLSSEFWNIVLLRENYEKTDYQAERIKKFFISPKDQLLAYIGKQEADTFVKILNIEDQKVTANYLFPTWNFIEKEREENMEWSPKEDYLLIPLKKEMLVYEKGKKAAKMTYGYFVADPNKGTSFNLNDLLEKKEIRNVRWDPEDKNYVFFLEGEKLYRSSIQDKNDLVLIAEDVAAFDLAKTGVYYAQLSNHLLFKKSLDGKSDKTQITFDFPKENSSRIKKVIVYDELRIAFITNEKKLYLFNKGELDDYFQNLGSDIEGIQFSDDGKKLLFWNNNEINVHFLRNWNVQPFRKENETQNITRYSEKIDNVQWFEDYEHIVFSVSSNIKIIELDPRYERTCYDILPIKTNNPSIVFNHYLEKMFFTDDDGTSSNLYSIDIPEKITILGL